MRTTLVLLAPLLLGACARPVEFVAPAPAGALDCALREAEHLGYARVTGEPDERDVRVAQRIEPPPAQGPLIPPTVATPTSVKRNASRPMDPDPPLENQLLLREQDGRLHIQVVSVVESGREVKPTADATSHAQMILARCTA